MSDSAFVTLAGLAEAEIRIRGSRFLAVAFPATNETEARAVLDERGRERFDATHHCGAWRFREGVWRAIDAGEPTGSAGAPILAAIDGAGLVDTAVIVTRYFGGTKLGVGGLVRAYGEAAANALSAAPRLRGIPARRFLARYEFGDTSALMRALERCSASSIEYDFSPDGRATVSFIVASSSVDVLSGFLADQTSARVVLEHLEGAVIYTH